MRAHSTVLVDTDDDTDYDDDIDRELMMMIHSVRAGLGARSCILYVHHSLMWDQQHFGYVTRKEREYLEILSNILIE